MRAKEITESNVASGVVKILQRKGYKLLGKGADQVAFLEPKTGLILKIFGTSHSGEDTTELTPAQKTFKAFSDYCIAHPNNPFLPQFSGWEKFVFDDFVYLQIRMERLFEFKENGDWAELLESIAGSAEYGKDDRRKKDFIDGAIGADNGYDDEDDDEDDMERAAKELFSHIGMDGFNTLWDTIYDLHKIADSQGFNVDLHSGNFMLGSDGHIVISDPFFIGWGRG